MILFMWTISLNSKTYEYVVLLVSQVRKVMGKAVEAVILIITGNIHLALRICQTYSKG